MAEEEEEDGKVEILGNEKGKNGKGVSKKKKGRERRWRTEMKK